MALKGAIGAYATYNFVRELTKSWDEMKAFELGIIDDEGNILKKARDLRTPEERDSYTLFHRLIWNTKRMLEKLPGGASKIKSYAAAAWLLRENKELISSELIRLVEFDEVNQAKQMLEEVSGPTNVTAGVAKKDNPLCKKKKKKSEKEEPMEDNSVSTLRRKIEEAKEVLEGKTIKRVVRKGKVLKKIDCGPGKINKGGKCVVATSADKQRFKKSAKKRKKKMAGKSLAGANRLRKKSLRKRSGQGL